MSRFDRDRSGGKTRFGGRPSFGARSSGPREMHKATCGNCGASCEVPFRPSGERPVLCSNCFEKSGGRDSRDSRGPRDSHRSDSRSFDRPPRMERPQRNEEYAELNAKLDRILKILKTLQPVDEEMTIDSLVGKTEDEDSK